MLTTPRLMPVWSRDAPHHRIVIDLSATYTSGGQSSRPMCGSHMLLPMLTCLMILPAGHRSYPTDSWKTWELCGCLSTSRLTVGGRLQGDPRCPTVLWRPDVLADSRDGGTSGVTVAMVLDRTWALGPGFGIGTSAPRLPQWNVLEA